MRKLGIVFAVAATAALGLGLSAGTAHAQTQVCDALQSVSDGAKTGDPGGFSQPGGPGTPVKQIAGGAAQSCSQSIAQQKPVLDPLLCGVADGLDGTNAQLGAVTKMITDPAIRANFKCTTPTTVVTQGKGGGGGGGDGGPGAQVLAANQTAGGGLPRTGAPEMLAGLGFGLTSLGAFARRFIR